MDTTETRATLILVIILLGGFAILYDKLNNVFKNRATTYVECPEQFNKVIKMDLTKEQKVKLISEIKCPKK